MSVSTPLQMFAVVTFISHEKFQAEKQDNSNLIFCLHLPARLKQKKQGKTEGKLLHYDNTHRQILFWGNTFLNFTFPLGFEWKTNEIKRFFPFCFCNFSRKYNL